MPETTDESKRNRRTAKRILAIGLPLILVAGVGIGYAYWTGGGSGSGSATTATPVDNLAFADVGAPSGLAPGVTTPAPITVDVTNNGTSTVHLSTVTVAFATTSPITGPNVAVAPACTTADYTLGGTLAMTPTTPDATGGVDVPPGLTKRFSGANIVFKNNASSNQDSCKGATVHLSYTAA